MRWAVNSESKQIISCSMKNIEQVKEYYELLSGCDSLLQKFMLSDGVELVSKENLLSQNYPLPGTMLLERENIPNCYAINSSAIIASVQNVRFSNIYPVHEPCYVAYEFDVLDCYGGSIPGVALTKPIGMDKLHELSDPFDEVHNTRFYAIKFVPVDPAILNFDDRVQEDRMCLFMIEARPCDFRPNGGDPIYDLELKAA